MWGLTFNLHNAFQPSDWTQQPLNNLALSQVHRKFGKFGPQILSFYKKKQHKKQDITLWLWSMLSGLRGKFNFYCLNSSGANLEVT